MVDHDVHEEKVSLENEYGLFVETQSNSLRSVPNGYFEVFQLDENPSQSVNIEVGLCTGSRTH